METPYTKKQGEIEILLDILFEKILEAFAETDSFSNESSPSIFLVYAHKSSSGNANAAWAVKLIKWLTAVRSRTFSDKSLVPGLWATREEKDFASVHDIVSNQFCLLPARSRVAKGKRVTKVDKVIVCCSEVLQNYSKDTRMDAYTKTIKNFYSDAEEMHQNTESIEAGIQELVPNFCDQEGFHHVITELAFLDIRSSRQETSHDIIPFKFDNSNITYLRCLDKTQTVRLKIKDNRSTLHPCQVLHKLFFELLCRVYESEEQSIKEWEKFYDECVQNLSQGILPSPEDFIRTTQQKEITTLDRLKRNGYATIRVSPHTSHEQPGLWSVPFEKNPSFVGRESLIRIMDQKLTSLDYCQRLALWGLGGTGKTQVALEYAYRLRKSTPNCAVFWIPAISAATFEESYLKIGNLLKIPGISESNADVKKLVQEKLSNSRARQWLLIIDNADDVDVLFEEKSYSTKPLIDFLPSSPRGSIIFTTRTREAAFKQVQANSNMLEVAEMSKPEAEDLLKKTLGEEIVSQQPEAVDTFLELLARLPLALIQATSFMTIADVGFTEYIAIFQNSETDTIKMLSENFEDRRRYREMKNPIATTWLVSFERIQEKHPLAASYLKFIACLLRENIPQSLLPKSGSAVDDMKAIGTLTAYSFLIKQGRRGIFDMHRLVHLATRNWLRDQKHLASQTDITFSRMSDVLPYGSHEDNKIWAEYLPHTVYIISCSKQFVDQKRRDKLLDKTRRCQSTLGQYKVSKKTHRQFLASRKKVSGDEHPSTLTSMNNLAQALSDQGKYVEAEKMHRQILALDKKVSGDEHPDTLTSMNGIASTLSHQKKYIEAEKMHRQILALRKKVLGDEHPSTLTSMNNLAQVLNDQGKYAEAETMHRETLVLRKKVLGGEHPHTLIGKNNLAGVLSNERENVGSETKKVSGLKK